MLSFTGRGILLDIEGTTSSVSFVYDVMFPFVRRELDGYLRGHWNEPALKAACDTIAREAGKPELAASKDVLAPTRLPALVEALLADGLPATVIDVGE